jgi:uncharacterized membrane protein
MKLGDGGESRVRGYLFVLGRSLRSFLAADVAADAVREVESHIRERLDLETGDERAAVERVLAELGPPLQVARAYSTEMLIDEAVVTGRFVPVLRAVGRLAGTSVVGFLWALIVFIGWSFGLSTALLAPLKLLFPQNVGTFYVDGRFHSMGAIFGLPAGTEAHPFGYWIVPVALVLGFAVIVATQSASRRILGWMRSRRPAPTVRLRVDVTGS